MPSVALMKANAPPLAFTVFQLILPWWLETSIPKGEAAETKLGKASARTASNFISMILLHHTTHIHYIFLTYYISTHTCLRIHCTEPNSVAKIIPGEFELFHSVRRKHLLPDNDPNTFFSDYLVMIFNYMKTYYSVSVNPVHYGI